MDIREKREEENSNGEKQYINEDQQNDNMIYNLVRRNYKLA